MQSLPAEERVKKSLVTSSFPPPPKAPARFAAARFAGEGGRWKCREGGGATTVLLIRHGHIAAIGYRLVARLPGVPLSDIGRAQALRLVERLRPYPIAAVYSSPLERAMETAAPLARDRNIVAVPWELLSEVDFGDWTGMTFDELDRVPGWRRFNKARSTAPVPGGETALEVQARMVAAVEWLTARHRGQTIAVVSHADVIRAAVLHYTGVPLDRYTSIDINPASVTAVQFDGDVPRVLYAADPA
jgi:broad specificity phosphatase PhoE